MTWGRWFEAEEGEDTGTILLVFNQNDAMNITTDWPENGGITTSCVFLRRQTFSDQSTVMFTTPFFKFWT